jgi:hypothetical protein
MMQNRVTLAQIWQMLARNMQLAGSQSLPAVSSTYVMPVGFSSPTLFSQVQAAVTDLGGEGAGSLMEFLGSPLIRPILPQVISEPITTMMQTAPIGGLSDPASFMYNQAYRQLGRSVPQVTLPSDFQNRFAVDRYNEQQKAFEQFAARYGMREVQSEVGPLEQLPISTPEAPMQDLAQVVGFRNVRALRGRDSSFNRAFTLFNEMNIFGPRITADLESNQLYQDLLKATTQAQAQNLLQQNVTVAGQSVPLQQVVAAAMDRGRMASGLISGAQMLAGFSGGNALENAEMQGLGEMLLNVLDVGNNQKSFIMQGAQSLGTIGNIGMASITGNDGSSIRAVDRIIASISDRINAVNPNSATNEVNPYTSLQRLGFGRSAQLISELSRGGLLSTGGVDVFGSISTQDVKQVEEALLEQLEGFSEIANVGRRLGFKTQDLIQNLQGVFGGRLNDALGQATSRAIDRFEADGGRLADELVQAEEIRRAGGTGPVQAMGAEERRNFLQLEARRQGSLELMTELGETVELGRMVGIDSKGVMATLSTATQIMQSMGMSGMGSPALVQNAFSRVALSRTTGSPITEAESLAMSSEILQRSTQNPDFQAAAVVIQAVQGGILDPENPQISKFLADFRSGVSSDYVNRANQLFAQRGVDPTELFNESNIRQAMSLNESIDSAMSRMATSPILSLTGSMERSLQRQFQNDAGLTEAFVRDLGANLGLGNEADFSSVLSSLVRDNGVEGAISRIRQLQNEGRIGNTQAGRLLAVLNQQKSIAGDGDTRSVTARILEENQIRETGATSPQIAAAAKERLAQNLSSRMSKQVSGITSDVLAAGLASVTEDLKEDKETALMQAAATQQFMDVTGANLMFAPNDAAIKEAEAELNKNSDFASKNKKTKDRLIARRARELALADPEKYSKSVDLDLPSAIYEGIRSEAEAAIDSFTSNRKTIINNKATADVASLKETKAAIQARVASQDPTFTGAALSSSEQALLEKAGKPIKADQMVSQEQVALLTQDIDNQIEQITISSEQAIERNAASREERVQAEIIRRLMQSTDLDATQKDRLKNLVSPNVTASVLADQKVEQAGIGLADLLKALGGNIGEDTRDYLATLNLEADKAVENFKSQNAALLQGDSADNDVREAKKELAVLEQSKALTQSLVDISKAQTPEKKQELLKTLMDSITPAVPKSDESDESAEPAEKPKSTASTAAAASAASKTDAVVAANNAAPSSATAGQGAAPVVASAAVTVTGGTASGPGASSNVGQTFATSAEVPVHVSINLDEHTTQTLSELLATTKAAQAALTSIDSNLIFKQVV